MYARLNSGGGRSAGTRGKRVEVGVVPLCSLNLGHGLLIYCLATAPSRRAPRHANRVRSKTLRSRRSYSKLPA